MGPQSNSYEETQAQVNKCTGPPELHTLLEAQPNVNPSTLTFFAGSNIDQWAVSTPSCIGHSHSDAVESITLQTLYSVAGRAVSDLTAGSGATGPSTAAGPLPHHLIAGHH